MKRILILSGPTHEHLDPVRFIGNPSSGRMGKALAEEAVRRGFQVDFVTGPVHPTDLPENVTLHQVTSAKEMLETSAPLFKSAKLIIFAAAVADYTPSEYFEEKLPKHTEPFTIKLKPTPDIAATLCAGKRSNQVAVGFALQTSDGEAHARRKLAAKKLDAIILNDTRSLGAGTGTFSLLPAGNETFENWGEITKTDCARRLFDTLHTR